MKPLPLVTQASMWTDSGSVSRFSDGLEAVVDFEDWLTGAVFEPLRDPETFRRFFLEAGAITWPNGADIAPEVLHERAGASSAASLARATDAASRRR